MYALYHLLPQDIIDIRQRCPNMYHPGPLTVWLSPSPGPLDTCGVLGILLAWCAFG
jgi:hypothetical protein